MSVPGSRVTPIGENQCIRSDSVFTFWVTLSQCIGQNLPNTFPTFFPQFEIVPEDDPQNAIVASSALTCHSNLLKAIASVRYSEPKGVGCLTKRILRTFY